MSRRSDGDAVAEALAGVVAMAVVAALVVAMILAVGTLLEVVRVYQERGYAGSPVARPLRRALGALCAVGGLAVFVGLAAPNLALIAAVVAAWAFLAFTVTILALDGRERRREEAAFGDIASLGTYLGPVPTPLPLPMC